MSKKETVRIGLVGYGPRGSGILKTLCSIEGVEITAVCDLKEDCLERAEKRVIEMKGYKPLLFTNYDDMIEIKEIDAIVNTAAWTGHIDLAIKAMKAGKDVAIEVGGAYSVRDCWKLVETQQETGKKCMMLENCCYGRYELALLQMKREGKFGTIVNCTGGYIHDLRYNFLNLKGVGLERVENHQKRNCDNYPTHALGPIAKLLDINKGNRMVSLTSTASHAPGMEEFCKEHADKSHYLHNSRYVQGDNVTTVIKCANGETITLVLSVTLPTPYTRNLGVYGTKGVYIGTANEFFFDDMYEAFNEFGLPEKEINVTDCINNAEEIIAQNEHPLWSKKEKNKKIKNMLEEGHGGMDELVCRAFIDCIKEDVEPPIDVYDCASWMVITTLSEQSIQNGSMPVSIPDFTNGKWISRRFVNVNKWSI